MVAQNIEDKIPKIGKSFNDYLKNPKPNSIFISPTTEQEIKNIIKSLDDNKASGPCSIPIKILKLIAEMISKPLSDIINISFTTGI